jgi:pyruvate dehydrogenase E2 component (dihydrolipoamide acetyltransferase)
MERLRVKVPQLGEGIHTVRVRSLLVQPSHSVKRDDPFAEVETDKATLVIESPVTGVVQEILCAEGDMIEVGSTFAWVDGSGDPAMDGAGAVDAGVQAGQRRVFRREAGPRNGAASPRQQAVAHQPTAATDAGLEILSPRQRLLAQHLREAHLSVVPASIEMELDWSAIEDIRRRISMAPPPTALELLGWAVTRAVGDHPRFRIQHQRGGPAVMSPHLDLGFAVALPDDELTTARVANADQGDFAAFVGKLRAAMRSAGAPNQSQAAAIRITDMSVFGVVRALPVIVAPAIATLFVGYPDWKPCRGDDDTLEWRRYARLVLSFDHCFVNGAGAALFLQSVIDYSLEVPGEAGQ